MGRWSGSDKKLKTMGYIFNTIVDEKGRITLGYIDNNNQVLEIKILLDGIEVETSLK